MADIETYGGCCPNCQKSMLQKADDACPLAWFTYDACVWCGFAYAIASGNTECTAKKIWESIFDHFGVTNREELIATLNLPEIVPQEKSDFYPSAFGREYTEEELAHIRELNQTA